MSNNILSYIAVYNHDTYVHVSLTSASNVGMSPVMLIIHQHQHLEIAIWKFLMMVTENTKISAWQTP